MNRSIRNVSRVKVTIALYRVRADGLIRTFRYLTVRIRLTGFGELIDFVSRL